MKTILGVLLCCIGTVIFAQQKISGFIWDEQNFNVNNVLVINMSDNTRVYSDAFGKFIIEAGLGDEIRFVKEGFYRTQIHVSEENFKTNTNIFLKRSEILIPEVKIEYKPTGDIKKDTKYLDDSKKVASLKSSMESYMKSPMTEVVPKSTIPKSFGGHDFSAGQVNVLGILAGAIGLVNKATKPKITKANFYETQNFIQRVKNEVDLNFLKKYGMDEEQIDKFLAHAETVKMLSKRYRKDFKVGAISYELQAVFAEYKKTNKLSD
ncbi:hypothetical protein [Chryseobacterium taiwanense]|uniref:Carboxypeptidase regulatory-like domain-containing protein n=1 Tax=Chryseobacterium taiwanense TaxID=363331 RepID=A0A0B4DEF3_9FLAO|nr:hypothetical protein [Chryseobacterium taiwanense]KIC65141.1 hypothetical protein RM51_01445 [Chryseobacterium taiwanense]